ncbi:hypothetical protein F4680DRAFT_375584 [Xylaria scruposa]|nr:hypothetical protein F4680DRAFT_375584 [Xylaria scruposa]
MFRTDSHAMVLPVRLLISWTVRSCAVSVPREDSFDIRLVPDISTLKRGSLILQQFIRIQMDRNVTPFIWRSRFPS